jgi:hypothetical protein
MLARRSQSGFPRRFQNTNERFTWENLYYIAHAVVKAFLSEIVLYELQSGKTYWHEQLFRMRALSALPSGTTERSVKDMPSPTAFGRESAANFE